MNAFSALAVPTRLEIFELIANSEKSVTEIAAHFTFKMPTISEHIRALHEAHLVTVRCEGRRRIYAVDEAGLLELEMWVQRQRGLMNAHANALERHLKSMD